MRAIVFCVFALGGQSWAEDFRDLRADDGRCLDASSKGVALNVCDGRPSQRWRTTTPSKGFVKLSTEASPNLCLDIINDGTNNQLQLAKCANASGQNWKIQATSKATRLTTEWRGDDQCLAVADSKPRIAACSKGSNAWTFVEPKPDVVADTEPPPEAASEDGAFDGEVPSDHAINHEFVLRFDESCRLAIPGHAGKALRILRCRHKGSDIRCSVRSATSMEEVFSSLPSLKVLRAPLSKDSARALAFATPAGKFAFTVDTRSGIATLTQPKTAPCTGKYTTYDVFKKMAKQYRDENPEPEAEPSPTSEESSPSPSPRSSKPDGAARGRMCNRPSDCASGVCKMENKTRGRCQ